MPKVVFGFDLDGTITSQEILPQISRQVDLFDEISVLTEATIRGVIPFEKSFRLRVRLLRDVPISRVQNVVSGIPLNQQVADFIAEFQDHCFVLSGNLDVWIKPLVDRLGCPFFLSEANSQGDQLEGIAKILDKGKAVRELKQTFDTVVVIGEGMNDVPMFEVADIKIAFGGVHSPNQTLLKLSDFVTYGEAGLCRLLKSLL